MKFLFLFVIVIYIAVTIDAQFTIPDNLKPEAESLRKEMEKVGVRFIGDMPDPTSLGKMTPELKAKGDAFKQKLMAAGVFVPPMPGA